jgi:hypothetical protein
MAQLTTPKREYSLYDVTRNDALLIQSAASLPEKTWFCYGHAWYKLSQLEMIDDDLRPTPFGLEVARKVLEQ